MIKAATICLASCLLLASTPAAFSQAVNPGTEEAVRREAARITLRNTLTQAAAAESRGELLNAARLYDTSWELVQTVGPQTSRSRPNIPKPEW